MPIRNKLNHFWQGWLADFGLAGRRSRFPEASRTEPRVQGCVHRNACQLALWLLAGPLALRKPNNQFNHPRYERFWFTATPGLFCHAYVQLNTLRSVRKICRDCCQPRLQTKPPCIVWLTTALVKASNIHNEDSDSNAVHLHAVAGSCSCK